MLRRCMELEARREAWRSAGSSGYCTQALEADEGRQGAPQEQYPIPGSSFTGTARWDLPPIFLVGVHGI